MSKLLRISYDSLRGKMENTASFSGWGEGDGQLLVGVIGWQITDRAIFRYLEIQHQIWLSFILSFTFIQSTCSRHKSHKKIKTRKHHSHGVFLSKRDETVKGFPSNKRGYFDRTDCHSVQTTAISKSFQTEPDRHPGAGHSVEESWWILLDY